MKLQVNMNGSWRAVIEFPADRRDDVLRGVVILARVMGSSARWSFVDDDGKREWLGTLSDAVEAGS